MALREVCGGKYSFWAKHRDIKERHEAAIRELKLHVHHKWQTSDSSWEQFLKIENERIETAQKIHMDKTIAWNY